MIFKVILKDTIFQLVPLSKFWVFLHFLFPTSPVLAAHGDSGDGWGLGPVQGCQTTLQAHWSCALHRLLLLKVPRQLSQSGCTGEAGAALSPQPEPDAEEGD